MFIQIAMVLIAVLGILLWSSKVQAQSREEIQKALRKIKTTSAPAPKMGAMCYEMALPAEYVEYACPLDGEKTVYSHGSAGYLAASSLPQIKNLLKILQNKAKNIAFSLDESKLCAKSFP